MCFPIHIRGKNKRNLSRKAKQLAVDSSTSTSSSKRLPGRPLKLDSLPSSLITTLSSSNLRTESTKPREATSVSRRPKKRNVRISPLETLPAELLHLIFVLSLNVSLPLVSRGLASMLSSDHVRVMLCLAAFTGSQFQLYPFKHFFGLPEVPCDSDVQNAILRQPWFTCDILKRCKAKYLEAMKAISGFEPPRKPVRHGDGSFTAFKREWPWFSKEVQMPERLCHEPWPQDKRILLHLLSLHGLQIDWVNTFAGEVAMASFQEAIISGKADLIDMFMSDLNLRPTTEMMRHAITNLSLERPEQHKNCGVRMSVLRKLMIGMGIRRGQNPGFETEIIDWDDAEMMAWAVKARESGDWRGALVLDIMHSKRTNNLAQRLVDFSPSE